MFFTSVRQEFCPMGGGGVSQHAPGSEGCSRHTPWTDTPGQTPPGQTPPGADTPWEDTPGETPPGQTPPQADTPWADTPPGQTPLWSDTPSPRADTPLGKHSSDDHCSRRYASYWNAFLFQLLFRRSPQFSIEWMRRHIAEKQSCFFRFCI